MPRAITAVALAKTDDELKAAFATLGTRADVAALLQVSEKELIYLLYRGGKRYIEFDVPKRAGGTRHIAAPDSSIKILQKRLNQVLQAVYAPKAPVHGFARHRSILTNADKHVRKCVVLNVDLEDFFPSIHFGRVRGVFEAEPFNLCRGVAEALANVCCHNKALPQGAPTSPVVSNMVCVSLDSGLRRLAQEHGCTYTRYADDITLSTTRRRFPKQLVSTPDDSSWQIGDAVRQVIEQNSFRINGAKVRLRTLGQRHEVTGLVVGKGVNVPREFIKNVRGMLHAWETHGKEAAEAELRARHHRKHRRPGSPPVSLLAVIAGKLEFIRMIRGTGDPLYTKLWNRFAKVAGAPYEPKVALVKTIEQINSALWVVESRSPDDPSDLRQGTAFALNGPALVSCNHCIGVDPILVHQPGLVTEVYTAIVTHRDVARDLVRLRIVPTARQSANSATTALRVGDSARVNVGDATLAAGFGNYATGASSRLIGGHITGQGPRDGVAVFFSDHRAFAGHSGGPILNAALEVVGVLQRAITPGAPGQETTILPISLLAQVPAVPLPAPPDTDER
jgi:RNA-directed DNA polymerase